MTLSKVLRRAGLVAVLLSTVVLGGCSPRVGVGVNVSVPVGNHGHVSVGTGSRWY